VFMTSGDPQDEATWQELLMTSKNFHTVQGLESHKSYYFRLLAIGTAGEGMQSDPAMGRAA